MYGSLWKEHYKNNKKNPPQQQRHMRKNNVKIFNSCLYSAGGGLHHWVEKWYSTFSYIFHFSEFSKSSKILLCEAGDCQYLGSRKGNDLVKCHSNQDNHGTN